MAMMHITKTWFEDGKTITEIIPAETVYKREWVGLTAEESEEIQKLSTCYEQAVEATEAKLREKNST